MLTFRLISGGRILLTCGQGGGECRGGAVDIANFITFCRVNRELKKRASQRASNATDERENSATAERENSVTAERENSVTDERENSATAERVNSTTAERENSATAERENSATGVQKSCTTPFDIFPTILADESKFYPKHYDIYK